MNAIVVEFSLSQRCFHKQSASELLQQNIESIMKRNQTDYIPIGIFDTDQLADLFIEKIRDTIKDYTMFKDTQGNLIVLE